MKGKPLHYGNSLNKLYCSGNCLQRLETCRYYTAFTVIEFATSSSVYVRFSETVELTRNEGILPGIVLARKLVTTKGALYVSDGDLVIIDQLVEFEISVL